MLALRENKSPVFCSKKGAHVGQGLVEAEQALLRQAPGSSDSEILNSFCRILVPDTNARGDRAEPKLWSRVVQDETLATFPKKLRYLRVGFASRMAEICWARVMATTEQRRIGMTDAA